MLAQHILLIVGSPLGRADGVDQHRLFVGRLGGNAELFAEVAQLCGRWPSGGPGPGTVLAVAANLGLVLATGGCPLLLRRAQLEGKAASEGQALIQQLGLQVGDQLGDAEA